MVGAAAGAESPLAQDGEVGIVFDEDRAALVVVQDLAEGQVEPTGEVGGVHDDAAVAVERPGCADGDGKGGAGRPGDAEGLDGLVDVVEHGLRAISGNCWTGGAL